MPTPLFPDTKIRLAPLIRKEVPLVGKTSAAEIILDALRMKLEDCETYLERKGKEKSTENPREVSSEYDDEANAGRNDRREGNDEGNSDPQGDSSEHRKETSQRHHRKHRKPHTEMEREQEPQRQKFIDGKRHISRHRDKSRHGNSQRPHRSRAGHNGDTPYGDDHYMMTGAAAHSSDHAPIAAHVPTAAPVLTAAHVAPMNGNLSLSEFDDLNINEHLANLGSITEQAPRPGSANSIIRATGSRSRQRQEAGRRRRRRRRERSPSPPKLGSMWRWGQYAVECVKYEAERRTQEEERRKRRERREQRKRRDEEEGKERGKRGEKTRPEHGSEGRYEHVYPERDEDNHRDSVVDDHRTREELLEAGYGFEMPSGSVRNPSANLPPNHANRTSLGPDRLVVAPEHQRPISMPDPTQFIPPLPRPPYPSFTTATVSSRMPSSRNPGLTDQASIDTSPKLSMPSTPRLIKAMLDNQSVQRPPSHFPKRPPESQQEASSGRRGTGDITPRSRSSEYQAVERKTASDNGSDDGSWGGGDAGADVRKEMNARFAGLGKGIARGIGLGAGVMSSGEWVWDKVGGGNADSERRE